VTRPRLVVFAKEPAPGRVKTRLAREMGAGRAAALYEAFLTDLAAALVAPAWESVLAADGSGTGGLDRIFASGWSRSTQGNGSLGDRLARAVTAAFDEGAEKVVLAGSDAPTLSAADVEAAFAALDGADVAVAPAPDGGFTLAALRSPVNPSELFGTVRWSTEFALSDLCRNAVAARLEMALLPEIPDVDVAEDLPALCRSLARDRRLAPATRAILGTL
jgi:rSAM/selenodomain-associated transferase 1